MNVGLPPMPKPGSPRRSASMVTNLRLKRSGSKRRARSRLRDAGGHVMKMIEAEKMPKLKRAKILPHPQAESACRRPAAAGLRHPPPIFRPLHQAFPHGIHTKLFQRAIANFSPCSSIFRSAAGSAVPQGRTALPFRGERFGLSGCDIEVLLCLLTGGAR